MKNLLCVATGIGALSGLNAFAQTGQQPNVVIIVADDLGYGDLSCYGATRIHTPGMDRRANEGLRFTQGYCTAATSTPSRYSLLTGLYPWTNKDAKILPGNAALIINTQQIHLTNQSIRHSGANDSRPAQQERNASTPIV